MKYLFGVAATALLLGVSPASAECGDSWDLFGDCIIAPLVGGDGMPEDDRLLNISSSTRTKLDKNEMYGVTVSCALPNQITNVGWNPFVKNNLVTSHVVALTTQKLGKEELPTGNTSRANFTVFSVAGDAKAKKVFLNKKCKTSFLVSGRESLFLAASANQATANKPGPVTRFVYEAVQVAIPILPLIKGTALATTILSGVAKTEDPLNKMIAELDKGTTVTKSDDLYLGDNIIVTPYSRVNVRVHKIKSVLIPTNAEYLKIFEDAVDTAQAGLGLSGAADPTQKCTEFARGLKGRNFATRDIAYALVLASQAAGLSRDNTLNCLSATYALEALASEVAPAWKRYGDKNYSEADAKSRFAASGGPLVSQPDFSVWKPRLQIFVSTLGGYLQSKGAAPINWSRFYVDPIKLLNTTTFYSPNMDDQDAPLATHLQTLIDKNFLRAGCLTSDNQSLAVFILFRATDPNQKQFKSSDTIAARVWYNENQRVYRVQLDYDVALLEKALTARGTRICGEDLEVLPPPKS